MQHFQIKVPCQKPALKQLNWGKQNGATPKNGALPVTPR